MRQVKAQIGLQTKVCECTSDIAVIGGSMGSGKSFSIILDILKHIDDPSFRIGIFRKSRPNLVCAGGLWDELLSVLDDLNVKYRSNKIDLVLRTFFGGKPGANIHFVFYRRDFRNYLKGTQYSAIYIDEGDEFDEEIFRFLLARLRSRASVKPYMRITCNPSVGWVKDLIGVFLHSDGYPDRKACEKEKYLMFLNDRPLVKDTKAAFFEGGSIKDRSSDDVLSLAFIPGTIQDNQYLLDKNPAYISQLKMLSDHERDKYLYGWWGELPKDGLFQKHHFNEYFLAPPDLSSYFVVADTACSDRKNSDYSVATLWGQKGDQLYLLDMVRGRWKFAVMRDTIKNFLEDHQETTEFYIENSPSGMILYDEMQRAMPDVPGLRIKLLSSRGIKRRISTSVQSLKGKAIRAYNALNIVDGGLNVYIPDTATEKWSKSFLREVLAFSADLSHSNDDMADTFFYAVGVALKKAKRVIDLSVDTEIKLIQTVEV